MHKKERRFRDLVKASGQPQVVTLWAPPQKDQAFMKAIKENRVLTVVQEPRANKKDFGIVGYHKRPHASYLVFPKPLEFDRRSRVVGISYDLVRAPKVSSNRPKAESVAGSKPSPPPAPKSFHIVLRRVAVLETSMTVPARNKKEAGEKALQEVNAEHFDLSKAVVRNEIKSIG